MKNYLSKQVSNFFDGYSTDFDEIYDDELNKKNFIKYYVSRYLRRSMFSRFSYTIEALRDDKYMEILDMGCGAGRYSHELAKLNKKVFGIDFSSNMIELAKKISDTKNIKNTEFKCISAEEFKFEKSYDAVICLGFFDYIEKPSILIDKIVKSKSKKFIGSFPKKKHILSFQRKVRYQLRKCPLYLYSLEDLEKLKNSLKIENTKIIDLGRDYLLEINCE